MTITPIQITDSVRPWSEPRTGQPTRVVVHRTANPDATGRRTMTYFAETRAASVQIVIDAADVFLGPALDQHAWHVLEHRKAEAMGFPVRHLAVNPAGGKRKARGDIRAIGIEVREEWRPDFDVPRGWTTWPRSAADTRARDAAIKGGKTWWTPQTVDTLAEVLADWLPREIGTDWTLQLHSELDPWQRSHDPDGLMAPEAVRLLAAQWKQRHSGPAAPATPIPGPPASLEHQVENLRERMVRLENWRARIFDAHTPKGS